MRSPDRRDSSQTGAQGRWALALVLAIGEYLLISLLFDASTLRGEGRWTEWLSTAGAIGPLVPAIITALLVFGGGPLIRQLAALTREHAPPPLPRALVLHGLAYALLLAATQRVFGGRILPAGLTWPLLWLSAAALWGASLALLPLSLAAWSAWLRSNRVLFLGALALGLGAFLAGWGAGDLWEATSWWTLGAVHQLLLWLEPQVVAIPSERLLGTPTFSIVVAPICSGYEGIGLITVFLVGFLMRFRDALRFPHALLLLPVAIVTVWLLNVLRIAVLVEIGTHLSPSVAHGGFHSKAGWVIFCGLALGIVAITHRMDGLWKPEALRERQREQMGENPVTPYLMPMLVMIAVALLTGLFSAGTDGYYGARVLATALALWWYRRVAPVWRPRLSWEALTAGVGVFVMWWLLAPPASPEDARALEQAISAMPPDARMRWVLLRLLGTCVTVPIAEELAFRGFLLRRLIAADFAQVDFQRFSWLALVVSSLAFGLLHQGQWLAATLAGVAYALTQWRTGRLGDAVTAHAITNAMLGAAVLGWGQWQWW